ncbi:MAG: carboxypeptidase-like regulatory domain-containing protein, partial [Bryobacteraceae bacterium]
MSLFRLWAAILAIALAANLPLSAQTLYGTLIGNVVDQSQGAVPKATVTVLNRVTGFSRETTTDDRGFYEFQSLPAGIYELKLAASGFVTYTQTDIEITINTLSRVNVQLKVGAVTESVTVAAEVAVLQTDRSDVRYQLAGGRQINQLPLSAYRNYQTLINLVPGATPARFQNAITDSPARGLTTNINGTGRNTNNTRIDGATSVFTWLPHHVLYVP